ncbi:sensor histidine kinase [Paenibacillus thalictri]|uniref:Sensor histidine kinase n=1 Tax=Paenibacillus thalictri TaxID=2527873 RepID=A0A4Q9DL53_9BACL|nr:histidine kinase [Paenibacillus thalictri]TBL75691.1 hypothetical protein EYB31_22115 [Paenibacillus thalictri]
MTNELHSPFADKTLKRKFFRKHLANMLLLCLIPLLILGSLAIYISDRYIRLDAQRSQEQMLNQYNELIEIIAAEVDSLSLSFDMDPKITTRLSSILSKTNYSYDDIEALFYLKNIIDVPANSKPYVHSVYVYYENDKRRFLSSREGLVDELSFYDVSWFPTYRNQTNFDEIKTEVRGIHQYAFEREPTKVISLYKFLSVKGVRSSKGVIVVNMLPAYLEKAYQTMNEQPDRQFFITDNEGRVIMHSGGSGAAAHVPSVRLTGNTDIAHFDEGLQHITVKKANRLQWNLISVVPRTSLFNLPAALIAATGLLSLASLAICAGVALWLTRKNYQQVYGIIHILESVDSPNPIEAIPQKADDIYALIIQNIVESFIEQKYLKVQLSERLYKMQALEFKALQSQINPHFLYNTLNSVYWKSVQLTGAPNAATQMIELLSEILQYALNTSKQMVTLNEEMTNIDSYIGIQQMRYKDRFEVIWDNVQPFADCRVLKLSVQPFIENSIHYGVEAKAYLHIKIKIRLRDSVLSVTIVDNGPGMDPSRLSEVRAVLMSDQELPGHVGISNTNKRLVLQYGQTCRIKLLSKKGWGTAVTLYYPQHVGDND